MANILLQIGKGVEADAEDVLHFFEDIGKVAESAVSPRSLLALALLAVPLGQAIASSGAAAAQDGLNIPLDIQSAQLIVQLWPDLEAYIKTLAVQPAKG